jgi:hypothetical protein
MRLAALSLATLLLACGGDQKPAATTTDSTTAPARDPEADKRAESERKLRAAQDSAVEAMCERLVDCSVEDAKATMSKEELDKLKPDELVPQARAQCQDDYGKSALSPRQIKIIQGCVNEAEECSALTTCLQSAGSSGDGG